ncbi:Bacterial type II/III secretion system short domain protein [Novipirellula galeiformis]|uniref:Bacterial type II/III secretion system short domain protein n=1 Tax=Novipirellula galeiformis TaxID=2528004 RepID=A0A5C6BYX1_9BACT|nr:secretin N-terminal domain-containing protein [Novipirellula galeiformis]TWU17145.1 Bacterial type II/III secretion system short domain protein [Novipirellula galeiformis]
MLTGRLTAMRYAWLLTSIFAIHAAENVAAQDADLSRLAHPEVAERLSLDDAQRAQIQNLLLKRAEGLAATQVDAEKKAVETDFRQQILALLTDQQRAQFTASAPTERLMFQFREMKWDDVLNWFAAQQDLTLVMDRTPAGTFTYSDSRSYSAREGIDLLNSVLMTRGFTLVRREKMLVVMELNDSIPLELLPRVSQEQLDERGRFEIVSVQFPLAGRPIEAVLQEVKPYLSGYGRAIPLARGSQLLVVETAGKMKTINELIAAVPLPKPTPKPEKPAPPPKPVFAAYPLGDMDSAAALETILKLIPSEQITVDAKTGVLSAYVIPEQQTAIKTAIDQMHASRSGLSGAESVAYPLSGMQGEQIQSQLARLVPRATITVTSDRILVTGASEDQALIRSAMQALDIKPVTEEKSLRIYEVAPAAVEQVATALRSFLPNSIVATNPTLGRVLVRGSEGDLKLATEVIEIWQQSEATAGLKLRAFALDRSADAAWLTTVQQIVPNAKSWLGPGGRQLMLLGGNEEIAAIESILPQLLTVLPPPTVRQMQIYRLSKNQRSRRSSLTQLPTALADVTLVDGENSDELLVWASPDQHASFAKLLEQIDQPTSTPEMTVPRSYALEVQDVATVTQILTAEFPGAQLAINPDGDELTVLATAELQPQIEKRIEEFNVQLPGKPQQVLENYGVKGMPVAALQLALTPLLANARTTLDSDGNRLLVWADKQTHQELRQLVEAIGTAPDVAQQKVVMAYALKHSTATNVKLILDAIVRDASVVADDKLRQLVVTGTLETQATVKATLEQIDRAGADRQPTEIRSYETEQLNATTLLPTLQAMWPGMQLTADATANRVVASGTEQEQQQLQAALKQLLAVPGDQAELVKTYPVPFGEMTTLPAILMQLAPQALISSDPVSRTVTVWASADQQTRVQQALDELGKNAQNAMQPATYIVKPTQLVAVQSSLQTLFPAIGIAADTTTGQLIVVAQEETQKRVAAVIELLSNGPNAEENTTKVLRFDPKQIDLANVLSALQSTIPPQVRLESNPANHTILAIGSPSDLARVDAMVEKLVEQLPPAETLSSVVYPLQHADPTSALTVLTRLIPQATFAQDAVSKTISATATSEHHVAIAEFIKSFDVQRTNSMETQVYRFERANPAGLAVTLRRLMPDATFMGDAAQKALVATALPEQHQRIATIVKEYDLQRENTQTRVFTVGNARVVTLRNAVQEMATEAVVTADPGSNSLIVTATAEELEQIAEIIEQIEHGGSEPRTTEFYAVVGSQPLPLSRALQDSFPKVTFAADAVSGGLFATATKQDHAGIAQVIETLNTQPTRLPTLKSFVLKHAHPEVVADAIKEALGRRTKAGVSFNRETNSIFVVGSRDDLQVAEMLVEQIDVAKTTVDSRKLRVFPLGGADGISVTDAIENLFDEAAGADVDVRYDSLNEQLFVVGDAQQIAMVEETLKQLAPPERQLKIIELEATDPQSFKMAADALFEDEPYNLMPTITVSNDQQTVLVRATAPQLKAMEELLQQMGESFTSVTATGDNENLNGGGGRLRFVPVHRNSETLLEDLRRLWPGIGGNPIEVIRPEGSVLPQKPKSNAPPIQATPAAEDPRDRRDDSAGPNSTPSDNGTRLTSTPQSDAEEHAAETKPETKPTAPQKTAAAAPSTTSPPANPSVAPIVVVVGDQQWTLASADRQALDKFQRLLGTLLSPRLEPFTTTGNYSVYLLRHAGADQVQDLLTDLFSPPTQGRRSRAASFSDVLQRVKIVADARINALIVSGNRNDRRTVEELLGVLDSEELLNSLQQITPTMITLQNASAENVERVLRDVYRSQLSAGAGRRPVAIPEGVSLEVATMLQQINAQASGPLLTVSVDEASNSLVLRAPPELTGEIRTFIESLDQQAKDAPSRRVDLIRLRSTNTASIEKALRILMAK